MLFAPTAGIDWYRNHALELKNVADQELLEATKTIIAHGVAEGWSQRELMDGLEQLLPYSQRRLETIARVESMKIYNAARMEHFDQVESIVAYKYLVIVDDRTTEIGMKFVGKVVAKKDLRYIPPLHFGCRTILSPVFEGQKIPRSDRLSPTTQPMDGFGELLKPGTAVMPKVDGAGMAAAVLRDAGRGYLGGTHHHSPSTGHQHISLRRPPRAFLFKGGIHLKQVPTTCSMGSWERCPDRLRASITRGTFRNSTAGSRMRPPAGLTSCASGGRRATGVFVADAWSGLGQPREVICIVEGVAERSRLRRAPCSRARASPCGPGFKRCGG